MLRVDPNCEISTDRSAAASASSLSPGPSWPKSSTQRSGRVVDSIRTLPGRLSTATMGRSCSRAQVTKVATSG